MVSLDMSEAGRRARPSAGARVLQVYVATIFLSAFLLFSVQPVFAKMVLPKLGGSPSVWAVSMCFFQAVLLGGYLYAHVLNRFAPGRLGAVIHCALMALAMLALPFGLPGDAAPSAANSYVWLIWTLAAGVGIPFFMVSANAPLLQSWFARSGHPHAADPYFLYGASNLGSLIALLSYPVVAEPRMGLMAQSATWSVGFVALTAMIALSAAAALGRPVADAGHVKPAAPPQTERIAWRDRLSWVMLAFVPSGLLTAYTTHLTTDITSAPFLWVLPLAGFLATFVLVFHDRPLVPAKLIGLVLAPLIGAELLNQVLPLADRGLGTIVCSAVTFLVVTLDFHGALYKRRPGAGNLTEFYLWMSFGGVLGGSFASLIAPQIFNTVVEYPLLYIAAILARPALWRAADEAEHRRAIVAAGVAAGAVFAALVLASMVPQAGQIALRAAVLAVIAVAAWWRLDDRRSALMLGGVFTVLLVISNGVATSSSERSFFGVVRVSTIENGQFRIMQHGTTLHGAERILTPGGEPVAVPVPATYYHPTGPMAQGVGIARSGHDGSGFEAGVVGLGTGALACYGRPGETWRFYEIDPVVVKVASDPKRFSFLDRCAPSGGIVVGDARLTLGLEPRAKFDYLVIDAFSSDAVPVHLLTAEAMQLYLDLLKPGGLLALHVSSRYMALPEIAAATAASLPGAKVAVVKSAFPAATLDVKNSNVVFISKDAARIKAVMDMPGALLPDAAAVRPWTDDYSDVLGAIWLQLASPAREATVK